MQPMVIVGAGLVGAAMAVAAARAGQQVALIEPQSYDEQLAPSFDGRASAIADVSINILSHLGIWQRVAEYEPITDILVYEQKGHHRVHYDCRDIGGTPFGAMVENRLLRRALMEAVRDEPLIALHMPVAVTQARPHPTHCEVLLDNGQTLTTPLLLVADGRRSAIRSQLGIEAKTTEYGQTAMVVTLAHSQPHKGLAVEAFYPSGPLALLPLTHNRSNLVWTERTELAEYLMQLSEEEFLAEIKKRDVAWLGDMTLCSERYAYPLTLVKASQLTLPRVALVGDAGHGIHPIAGQGVNLGYRDVAVLYDLLREQMAVGLDIGDATLLSRYAAKRKLDVASMSAATDALNRLFSNAHPPVRLLRDTGLGLVERLPPVKRFIMRQAMGQRSPMPRLMQPFEPSTKAA